MVIMPLSSIPGFHGVSCAYHGMLGKVMCAGGINEHEGVVTTVWTYDPETRNVQVAEVRLFVVWISLAY